MTHLLTTKRLLVYVAGPYTPTGGGDIDTLVRELEHNLCRAVEAAEAVLCRGHVPIIPHTHTNGYARRTVLPQTSGLYYHWDKEVLARCDAIYRYAHSFGADREWRWAKEMGLLRVSKVEELPKGDSLLEEVI